MKNNYEQFPRFLCEQKSMKTGVSNLDLTLRNDEIKISRS